MGHAEHRHQYATNLGWFVVLRCVRRPFKPDKFFAGCCHVIVEPLRGLAGRPLVCRIGDSEVSQSRYLTPLTMLGCQPRTAMNVDGGESSTTTDACSGTREELFRHENQENAGWCGYCRRARCSSGKRGRRSGRGRTRPGTRSHSCLGRTAASWTRMGASRRPWMGSARAQLGRGSVGGCGMEQRLAAAGRNLHRRPLYLGFAQRGNPNRRPSALTCGISGAPRAFGPSQAGSRVIVGA
jgi:hypothetical protein